MKSLDFNIFANIITAVIAIIILSQYFSIFFAKNALRKKRYGLWLVYFIWQILCMTVSQIPSYITLFVNILLIVFLCIYYYIGSTFFRIIVSILSCSIWTLLEILTGAFFMLIGLDINIQKFTGAILSKLLALLLILILKNFFKNEKIKHLPTGYYILMVLLPIGSIYIMYNIFYLCHEVQKTNAIWISIISLLIVLVINLIIFKIYLLLANEFETKHQNSIYSQQINAFEKYNSEREKMELAFRKTRHDFKQHYTIIYELLKQGNSQKAQAYMEQLPFNNHTTDKTTLKTGNIIIDSLVNSKFSDLDNTDIQLTMDINIPSQLPFAAADLGITFGNIIDNALEAVSRLQDMPKVIKLFALFDGNSLIITCINTYSGNIVTNSSGELITQKEDAFNHGYGIHSIKTIANKYHGAVTTSYDANTFTIKILLYAS